MDFHDEENLANRYVLCQIGFAFSGLALGLLSLSCTAEIALIFTRNAGVRGIIDSQFWKWGISAPITIGSFLGSYLLWGRWREPSWQRRVGALVLMNGIDLLLWVKEVAFGQPELILGQNRAAISHAWLQFLLSSGMGWAELILYAGLAADLSSQLGNRESQVTGRAAKTLSTVGLFLWGLIGLTQTHWDRWPLVPDRGPAWPLMTLGTIFLTALAAFQVTVLCMAAARQCRRYVRVLRHEDGHELLKSRSDDPDWGQDRDRW